MPETLPEDYRELTLLREAVKRYWVDGVLKNSLHGAALIDLGLERHADAVAPPLARTLEFPDRTGQALPAGTEMIDAFDEAGRALLILGAPGAGKTVSLLELARDLVARSEADPRQPVPVVLNLSTWTAGAASLAAWLTDALRTLYYVPERLSRAWLRTHRLLPLLDGLDEVPLACRAGCVEAVNAFAEAHGLPGLVVCSRYDEYTALPVRLHLRGAVCLQPLTLHQVDAYLAAADGSLAALRAALPADPDLQALARTPLMLSVMSLAYQDLDPHMLEHNAPATAAAQHAHLFDTYVRRMFTRTGRAHPYGEGQVRAGLAWLARHMREHAQTVFLIEQMQPSWLATRGQRWTYTLGSRLLGGLALGLILALTLGLMAAQSEGWFAPRYLLVIAAVGLAFGAVGGLAAGFLDAWRWERGASSASRLQTIADVSLYALVLGVLSGLVVSLADRPAFLLHGLVAGLVGGLALGVLFGVRSRGHRAGRDIQPVEALQWRWPRARTRGLRGLLAGLAAGAVVGLLLGLIQGTEDLVVRLLSVLLASLFGGLMGGLIGGVFGGLSKGLVATKSLPNQGIRLSLRNMVYGSALIGGAAGGVVGLPLGLIAGLGTGVAGGGTAALFFGLLAGLWYGGLDVIRHYTLRVLLYRSGSAPLRYADFLDHAVALIFLRRVGGGYTFIHRLLLEHFAARGPAAERAAPAPEEPAPA